MNYTTPSNFSSLEVLKAAHSPFPTSYLFAWLRIYCSNNPAPSGVFPKLVVIGAAQNNRYIHHDFEIKEHLKQSSESSDNGLFDTLPFPTVPIVKQNEPTISRRAGPFWIVFGLCFLINVKPKPQKYKEKYS